MGIHEGGGGGGRGRGEGVVGLVLKGKLILKFCSGVLYSSIGGCTSRHDGSRQ